jgi:hypothetical protein
VDGGWGIGGQVLTKAMLDGHCPRSTLCRPGRRAIRTGLPGSDRGAPVFDLTGDLSV